MTDLKPDTGLAFPAVVELIDELALLLARQDVLLDDAVALLKGAYIDAIRNLHPGETVAQLCTKGEGQEARLPMSRNTAFANSAKARPLKKASLARRIEQHLRHLLHASAFPMARVDVRERLLANASFGREQRATFNSVFDEVFDILVSNGTLVKSPNSQGWVCIDQHRHHTTEDEGSASVREKKLHDLALSAEMARRVARQLREVLETRIFIPYRTGTPQLPDTGLQSFSLTIRHGDIKKLDQFFVNTIKPFLTALTEHADAIKRLEPVSDPTDPNFVTLYHTTWMWSPEVSQ